MKTFAIVSLALCASIGLVQPGLAQAAKDEMQILRIGKPGAEKARVFGFWKERIAVLNRDALVALKPGQNGPFDILWKEFKDGDATIVASILFDSGEGGCEMGPNSSSSTQSWAANCPAKIVTIAADGAQRVRNSRACFQWFPLASRDDPPEPGERSYASYDAAKKTVSLGVTAKAKFVRACTRNVKL